MAQGNQSGSGNKASKTAASSGSKAAGGDAKARDNATAPGVTAPEPKDTTNAAPGNDEATGVAPAPEVQEQREQEQQEALDAAKAAQETEATGPATPAEKGQQTKAAADVREQAAADAEARAGLTQPEGEGDGSEDVVVEGGVRKPLDPNYVDSNDPVQVQRREEAEARDAAVAAGTADLSEEDQRLLGAAPGGQRTAMTKGKEGSTTVTHTAAQSRPPLSGPLDAPVTGIENYAATEDDPDNRVYADEAGPRDVFEDTDPVKARYVDADGNALDYDGIFEDVENKTYVTTKTRVYETFLFPNTTTEGKRLAYAAGKRVPRGEAENVRNQISVHSPIL